MSRLRDYLNPRSIQCSKTVELYVSNLTSSYTDQRNEAPMVATSVIMFVLAALFFNLSLFSRLSDISTILNPSVRLFLSTSLSLFLPVMSYLFSEAKNAATANAQQQQVTELSVRARTILMWMLLVELLRRKAEAILVTSGGGVQGYSGTIERAARIAWLGYLVFYNLRSAGKKALFGILWVFAASKLVQRFITIELGKRSFAYGKNPQLVSSYMKTKMLRLRHHDESSSISDVTTGEELLRRCDYVVMGEEELETTAGPDGYTIKESTTEAMAMATTKDDDEDSSPVVTVGRIWRLKLAAADHQPKNEGLLRRNNTRLKRMCLSFALYKLLRRRLEDFPITDAETGNCHDLIFNGLLLCSQEKQGDPPRAMAPANTDPDDDNATKTTNTNAVDVLQVFNDEVQFLCEYYHSVQPVVFASPFFFVANYVLFPILVLAACILTILLCSNGDVSYAFQSFFGDNRAVFDGIIKLPGCIMSKITTSAPELFTVVDIGVTVLLLLAFAYEEAWELVVFLISNWFLVSLLASYTRSSKLRLRRWWLGSVIRCIMWVRDKLSQPIVCVKQFSVLWWFGCCCHVSATLPTKAVHVDAKNAIVARLATARVPGGGAAATPAAAPKSLSNGSSVVDHQLRWACKSTSLAEVILTWHIATALVEAKHPLPRQTKPGVDDREVATALSGYCAYLVAFRPELLPDDKDGTERVYREMEDELRKEMGCLWYYCSGVDARCKKLIEIHEQEQGRRHGHKEEETVLHKGARLGNALREMNEDAVWRLLAELWTEVVTYAAPTSSERHVKAHKEALAQGGELITVLWALTTHAGIARAPVEEPSNPVFDEPTPGNPGRPAELV